MSQTRRLAITSQETLFARSIKSLAEAIKKPADPANPTYCGDYGQWLQAHFPNIAKYQLADHHHAVWQWFDSLEAESDHSESLVAPFPRGGAKSTTGELGVAYVGLKKSRNFGLYVSETQEQADKHVQSVGSLLESLGVERLVGVYGTSKGWKRNRLRTSGGFNLEAIGLDTASRGIKLDEYRPDLIIFDDIDGRHDSPRITEKKKSTIKETILPAGSSNVAILFLQNLIHENSIVSQLVKNKADFLLNRKCLPVVPAIRNLKVETYDRGDGLNVYRIIGGEASWEGQNLAVCEAQINKYGLGSFLREMQHEVEGIDGHFFDVSKIEVIHEPDECYKRISIGLDFAATEGGGDYTVAIAVGERHNGGIDFLDVARGQWGTDNVKKNIHRFCQSVRDRFGLYTKKFKVLIPQDPGAAGKMFAQNFKAELEQPGFRCEIVLITKKKAINAQGQQEKINSGNARMLEGSWNYEFKEEYRLFREDDEHSHDDQIDGGSLAVNSFLKKTWGELLEKTVS